MNNERSLAKEITEGFEALKSMRNNEPVAWMFRGYLYEKDPSDWTVHEHPNVPVIPLYTHPAKTQEPDCYGDGNVYRGVRSKDSEIQTIHIDSTAKTLTDEEIIQINKEEGTCWDVPDRFAIQLARAILRKASE